MCRIYYRELLDASDRMRCPACKKLNFEGRRFCSDCGAPLSVCVYCGFRNEPQAKFCGGCGLEVSNDPTAAPARSPVTGSNYREPERRQMTVLFCDLVDSTALANSLDLEDLRDLIRSYQATTSAVITQHNGFVARWIGDGILAYFGYPKAYEDATAQALRAGLGLVTAVRTLHGRKDDELRVRVGIATGIVVVGDVVEGGAFLEEAAVAGAAVNLASRLEALAEPGTVVISDSTRRLVRNQFDLTELGTHRVKGFDEPVAVWRVEKERPIESRLVGDGSAKDFELVGREQEMAQLRECWRLATGGAGQVALIRGEAGVGKSRLVRTLCDTLTTPNTSVWRYYCAPHFQNTALFPVMDQIQRGAGFELDDSIEVKIAKLESFLLTLDRDADIPAIVPYIASLLSLPTDDRYRPRSGSPERQMDRLLDIMVALTVSFAKLRPSMIIFEDAQWIDATSLALIDRLIVSIEHLPVLMLFTARPEFDPPGSKKPIGHVLELNRLDRSSSLQLVQKIAGHATLVPDLLEQIVEKCDGIPLFLEEITKTVLEARSGQDGHSGPAAVESAASLAVPSSLADSLMSRLDRLGDVKDVIQIGAAIGRRFSFALLSRVSKAPTRDLRAALARLQDADLISCRGKGTAMTCTFKHALVRDAAYSTLLRSNKRSLHLRIAEVLRQRSRTQVSAEPELLAYHMTEADLPLQAIPLWQEAGVRAASRATHIEATSHFTAALALLERVAEGEGRLQQELELRTQLGLSLSSSRGYAAPEVQAAYGRAREICTTLGNKAEHFPVLRGLWAFYVVRGELTIARDLALQCSRIGEETQRPEYLIEGYTALGYALAFMGTLTEGREFLEKAIQIYQSSNGERLAFQTPQDPCLACLGLLAIVSWMQGSFTRAALYRDQSLAAAKQLNRPFDLAFASCFAAMLENIRGDPAAAAQQAETAVQVSREHGFGIWLLAGSMHLAIARGLLDPAAKTIETLTALLDTWHVGGAELNRPFFLGGLSQILDAGGLTDKAIAAVDEAIAHAHHHDEHLCTALLYRNRASLLKRKGDPVGADAALAAALNIARRQGAKGYELLILRDICASPGEAAGKDEILAALRTLSNELGGSDVAATYH